MFLINDNQTSRHTKIRKHLATKDGKVLRLLRGHGSLTTIHPYSLHLLLPSAH